MTTNESYGNSCMPPVDPSNENQSSSGGNRYINDLKQAQKASVNQSSSGFPMYTFGLALAFLLLVAFMISQTVSAPEGQLSLLIIAAVIGGYMALNIGANDVANNMGPAVGGGVISVGTAILIAVVCESAGALLAGGDVVKTVAKGIISPDESLSVESFRTLMVCALLAAALWINLATALNAPVSTTHSIVGGVLGGGMAAAGMAVVNWPTIGKIAASWIISPVIGGLIAASLLFLIKNRILYRYNRIESAKTWVPILIGLMMGALAAYMATKGLKKIWKADGNAIILVACVAAVVSWVASRPYIAIKAVGLSNRKRDIYSLFHLPLIIGIALLSFAHGANDVANAVGPLAAIVSTLNDTEAIQSKVGIPFWVMVVGAVGIALGLALFGPKLIKTVGEKITKLNAARAYCVALSSAVTVLIATTLGLPVSSTHIAIGAIFGVGFLREFLESPTRSGRFLERPPNQAKAIYSNQNSGRSKRKLVRRRFIVSIASAWIITVPASACLAASLYWLANQF